MSAARTEATADLPPPPPVYPSSALSGSLVPSTLSVDHRLEQARIFGELGETKKRSTSK